MQLKGNAGRFQWPILSFFFHALQVACVIVAPILRSSFAETSNSTSCTGDKKYWSVTGQL